MMWYTARTETARPQQGRLQLLEQFVVEWIGHASSERIESAIATRGLLENSMLSARAADSDCGEQKCDYDHNSSNAVPIALGVVIPITFTAVALLVIWRIRKRRQRVEEADDKHASLDFGLGEVSRKGKLQMTISEKPFRRMKGMSMDMMNPYILPAELNKSQPSIVSLSRNVTDGEDPYRPVTLMRSQSPGASLFSRSPSRKYSASVVTTSSNETPRSLLRNAQKPAQSPSPVFDEALVPPLVDQVSKPFARTLTGMAENRQPPPALTLTQVQDPPTKPQDLLPTLVEIPTPSILVDSSEKKPLPEPPNRSTSLSNVPAQSFQDHTEPDLYSEEYETYADVLGIVQTEIRSSEVSAEGLGVHGVDSAHHRLSTSIRPLPPDDPEENPETRANRIRSFYREYFDDKHGDQNVPAWGYYEDYSQEYLDSGTLYDPVNNQFIVANNAPYAQPIGRRAMTPPPRAPPQFRSGASGSMYEYDYGRPRGYSSASAQQYQRRAPQRPLPAPAPLNNLPTPSLLGNDAALMNAADFAPPTSFRDRQAGRAESPLLGQRPYSPSVRAFTPLASSFDDLRVMPSPHMLRKSGTFTALDFAPPPRFSETGSDAGSIRSGRSVASAKQVANIRAGAYRVSRLPKGMVATKNEFSDSLRPTWGQRD